MTAVIILAVLAVALLHAVAALMRAVDNNLYDEPCDYWPADVEAAMQDAVDVANSRPQLRISGRA